MNWEKVCPNLSFTVENKVGKNDIPFHKNLGIYQGIGKNIFHWENSR